MCDHERDLCDDCIRPPEACSACENGSMFSQDDEPEEPCYGPLDDRLRDDVRAFLGEE